MVWVCSNSDPVLKQAMSLMSDFSNKFLNLANILHELSISKGQIVPHPVPANLYMSNLYKTMGQWAGLEGTKFTRAEVL